MINLPDIQLLFARLGAHQYSGEPVTQLEHALQTAHLAEQSEADDELVTACLLHDLGHLLNDQSIDKNDSPTLRGVDDTHQYFALPIKLHVDAKRYLCQTRPGYFDMLSADSKRSLQLQGGAFDAVQAQGFIAQPGARDAVRLRLWDDLAKQEGLRTPTLAHFLARAQRCALAG